MDRQTGAEVGGPYSNHDDADRAIAAGGFQASPMDLTVVAGDDDSDDGPLESHTAYVGEPPTQVTDTDTGPEVDSPELGQPVPDQGVPKTTKPSVMPGGDSGVSRGVGMPQDFSSEQFGRPDDFAGDTGGDDAVSTAIASLASRVRRENPHTTDAEARLIARQVIGRIVTLSGGLTPNIEDPLANRDPAALITSFIPEKKKPARGESNPPPDPEPRDRPGARPMWTPVHPMSPGAGTTGLTPAAGAEAAGAAGAGAAAEGGALIGAAEALPLLMI